MAASRYIVTCAGSREKWGGFLGTPPFLVPVHGKPLLQRTVALVRELDPDAAVVVTVRKEDASWDVTEVVGVSNVSIRYIHDPHQYSNEYESSRSMWSQSGRTVLLLGDVVWDGPDLERVVQDEPPGFRAYGRQHSSPDTPYGEIFAASIQPDAHDPLDHHLDLIAREKAARRTNRAGGWELQRSLAGFKLVQRPPRNPVDPEFFCELGCDTDDLDFPEDWAHMKKRGMI